jgi:hypothetical protein
MRRTRIPIPMAMTIKTASLLAACFAASALAVRPAAAQTDTVSATAAAPAAAAPAARPRRNPNLITRAEMEARGAKNALDGVRSLRGSWLRASRTLSATSENESVVAVYRDGTLLGGPNSLRDIGLETVATIQYFPPAQAVQRFGNDANVGAILVNTH